MPAVEVRCPVATPPRLVLNVTPLYQTELGCGPAAMAMVLNYHGTKVPLDAVTAALYNTSLKGTLITDMKDYAVSRYPSSHIEKSDICRVVDSISRRRPVILMIDPGKGLISSPHYVVAVGYDTERGELLIHDGYGKFVRKSFGEINDWWKKTGFLSLVVKKR